MTSLAALAIVVFSSSASAERPGHGGRPSFDRLLTAFDDGSESLTEEEVPARVWQRL